MAIDGLRNDNGNESKYGIPSNSSRYDYVLEEYGISSKVAEIFQPFYDIGKLKRNDFDERAIDALKSLSVPDAIDIANIFSMNNLEMIANKSAHLCLNIRVVRTRRKNYQCICTQEIYKPDDARMNEICGRTGYPYEKTAGQRKYGPAPMVTPPSANGHEIYVGSIPYSVCEDQLIPMMETCGTIYDLRMMVESATGRNKGFCFVTFVEDDAVEKAVQKFNGMELVAGMKIRVNPSIPNLKLLVNNLVSSKTKQELIDEFNRNLDGVVDIEITSSTSCIVTFDLHRHASSAKRKLVSARLRIFDFPVCVEWFVPEDMTDDLSLYIRNYDPNLTDSDYMTIFSKFGAVVRLNRYNVNVLFVHYSTKKIAADSLKYFNKRIIGDRVIEVSLARPTRKDKREQNYNAPVIMDNYAHYYPQFDPVYTFAPPCYYVYPDGSCEYNGVPIAAGPFPYISLDYAGNSYYSYYNPEQTSNGQHQMIDQTPKANGTSNGVNETNGVNGIQVNGINGTEDHGINGTEDHGVNGTNDECNGNESHVDNSYV